MREDFKGVSERDTREVSHQRRRLFEGFSSPSIGSAAPGIALALSRGQKADQLLVFGEIRFRCQKFSSGPNICLLAKYLQISSCCLFFFFYLEPTAIICKLTFYLDLKR